MGWIEIEVVFDTPIPQDRLEYLNSIFYNIDYDMPTIYTHGIHSNYRKPSLDITTIINLFHFMGHPCKGRSCREDIYLSYSGTEKQPWIISSDLIKLDQTSLNLIGQIDLDLKQRLMEKI